MTIGRKLLSALVQGGSLSEYIKQDLRPELFKDHEKVLFDFMQNHVAMYGKMPSVSTIEAMVGDVLVPTEEPPEFYLHELESRFLHNSLKELVLASQDGLKQNEALQVMALMIERINELHYMKHRREIVDFRDAAEIVHGAYIAQQSADDSSYLKFGWPTLDKQTGGLHEGDFASINGRPAAGKTFLTLYNALNAWDVGEHVPLYVSMEMMIKPLMQRLSAMHSSKPLTRLMKAMMSSKAYVDMMTKLKTAKTKERPFYVVDGNLTATAQDILVLARQLKPTAIYVDGAYLLGHENKRISRFEKITENAEFMKKHIATGLGIPVLASYQLNREKNKGSKKGEPQEDQNLDNIYGTDAIGQLSTLALGLFQADNVETMKRRRVKMMKGRGGETGEFEINWDFDKMDFSEVSEEDPADLQFID